MMVSRFRLLPSLLLAFLCDIASVQVQAADYPVFGDSLVRHNQVQNVLEHQPAKVAGCQHIVSVPRLNLFLVSYSHRL